MRSKLLKPIFFQPSKREHLLFLGEKHGFKTVDLNCNDDYVYGLLIFETFLDAYKFFREGVQHHHLEFRHIWYEIYCGKIATKLLDDIKDALNEDCIDEIAIRLDVVAFCDLLSVCNSSRLNKIANRRFANLTINRSTVGPSFGLMNLSYVFHVIGDIFENITISLHQFRGGMRNKWNAKLKFAILYIVRNLTGPKLQSVLLQNCVFRPNESKSHTLINELKSKNVAITNTE